MVKLSAPIVFSNTEQYFVEKAFIPIVWSGDHIQENKCGSELVVLGTMNQVTWPRYN
jgi:hypothetical protein